MEDNCQIKTFYNVSVKNTLFTSVRKAYSYTAIADIIADSTRKCTGRKCSLNCFKKDAGSFMMLTLEMRMQGVMDIDKAGCYAYRRLTYPSVRFPDMLNLFQ